MHLVLNKKSWHPHNIIVFERWKMKEQKTYIENLHFSRAHFFFKYNAIQKERKQEKKSNRRKRNVSTQKIREDACRAILSCIYNILYTCFHVVYIVYHTTRLHGIIVMQNTFIIIQRLCGTNGQINVWHGYTVMCFEHLRWNKE